MEPIAAIDFIENVGRSCFSSTRPTRRWTQIGGEKERRRKHHVLQKNGHTKPSAIFSCAFLFPFLFLFRKSSPHFAAAGRACRRGASARNTKTSRSIGARKKCPSRWPRAPPGRRKKKKRGSTFSIRQREHRSRYRLTAPILCFRSPFFFFVSAFAVAILHESKECKNNHPRKNSPLLSLNIAKFFCGPSPQKNRIAHLSECTSTTGKKETVQHARVGRAKNAIRFLFE